MSTTDTTGTDAAATFETRDPRTGELIAEVPEHSAEEVQAAVERARSAFATWSRLTWDQRLDHVLAVRDLLLDRVDEVVEVICKETGKLEGEAVLAEVTATCELIEFYRKHGAKALRPARVPTGAMLPHKKAWRVFEPMGVVGVISPWNYPLTLAMTPTVTAVLAGNAVVLKPSEVTPLVGLEVGRLFAEAGAHPDLVQVVTGRGPTGDALVRAGVQKVAFTGSVRTGKLVMKAAADTLTPVLLELGGKDPMIVCDDANLERAANGAVWGAFTNSGQTCIAVERVYVQERVYDRFVDLVVDKTKALRQGVGAGNDIGSMTFAPQVDIVSRHVDDALAKGARVLTGGQRVPDKAGLWYEPTVLVDVDHEMDVMREETFGPVLPIMAVADDDEAIRLANDSPYGLNSSVWSADGDRAEVLAGRVEAGNVCINDCLVNYGVGGLPFGGVKDSGIGRVHGVEGLQAFSNVKSVLASRVALKREPYWYPAPGWFQRTLLRVLRFRYRRGVGAKLSGG
ncbi:MAG TPA: aldehyde dehydrogenase family protein [Acidimicrobiales bacterium]|nr:aldehyde dehydrogenase family protein [Acidimicrobiales bacterium]